MTNEMANEEAKKRLEIWLKCHNCPEDKQCYDKHLNTVCEDYVFVVNNPLEDSIKAAIKALSAPDREKGEWIPVSERLPEESQTEDGYFYPSDMVLTFNSHGQYGVSRYWGNRISKKERPNDYLDWMDLPFYRQDILAWQPLPEPYKAESEEDKE